MKAIMISGKPKWTALIMNGKKTDEIRKNKGLYKAIQKLIDEYGHADIYWYCSKNGGNLVYGTEYYGGSFVDEYGITRGYSKQQASVIFGGLLNGKVLFKFRCYKVEEITPFEEYESPFGMAYKLKENKIVCCQKAQLTYDEYNHYLKGKNGYAIHINNLEIFDEPKELREFIKCDNNHIRIGNCFIGFGGIPRLTKAPQNFCYVEVE